MIIGIQAECRSGTKLRTEPDRWIWESLSFIWSMPPTAFTAATARMITIVILRTNWNRSVTSTPHSPASIGDERGNGNHPEHDPPAPASW